MSVETAGNAVTVREISSSYNLLLKFLLLGGTKGRRFFWFGSDDPRKGGGTEGRTLLIHIPKGCEGIGRKKANG